ncbi:arsenate reductase ArsC [Candidatus Albibeggiatoa sp. nov. NOAA]|uniref:arsenate reductase ArsC n=1 Tax=Candidatus Albibeggiatoa sp. nov. NOAA TaxID=3162724 RepID=UPI0032F9C471|nr:arsenate reductase ArsC [Thiotrichaceae bacterium]
MTLNYPIRVLFLCTHNSARSQMAEGFLREFGGKDFEMYSAGTEQTRVHPLAIKTMHENNIDITNHTSKIVNQFIEQSFDFVITVCDSAKDSCPVFMGTVTERAHWSFPDPTAGETEEQRIQAFHTVAVELRERVRVWVTVQRKQLVEQGVEVDLYEGVQADAENS